MDGLKRLVTEYRANTFAEVLLTWPKRRAGPPASDEFIGVISYLSGDFGECGKTFRRKTGGYQRVDYIGSCDDGDP